MHTSGFVHDDMFSHNEPNGSVLLQQQLLTAASYTDDDAAVVIGCILIRLLRAPRLDEFFEERVPESEYAMHNCTFFRHNASRHTHHKTGFLHDGGPLLCYCTLYDQFKSVLLNKFFCCFSNPTPAERSVALVTPSMCLCISVL